MAKKTRPVRMRPRRSTAERTKQAALDSQNPGNRRNFTVRDSQTYMEPVLFQMSGMFRFNTASGRGRTIGFGTFGV